MKNILLTIIMISNLTFGGYMFGIVSGFYFRDPITYTESFFDIFKTIFAGDLIMITIIALIGGLRCIYLELTEKED